MIIKRNFEQKQRNLEEICIPAKFRNIEWEKKANLKTIKTVNNREILTRRYLFEYGLCHEIEEPLRVETWSVH